MDGGHLCMCISDDRTCDDLFKFATTHYVNKRITREAFIRDLVDPTQFMCYNGKQWREGRLCESYFPKVMGI